MKPPKTSPARDVTEGLRERKRRQTRKAIAETGLRLFLKNGYDETTLDEIAATVDIARRTFFSYFESKEELVLTGADTGFSEALRTAFSGVSPKMAPFEAVRAELPRLASQFDSKYSIAIEELMRSSEALRRRRQDVWVILEQNLFEGLRAVWSDERETALRIVAMVGIGVMRVTLDKWWRERGKRPPSTYFREGFATLKSHV
jgi:AcrR family transcriptional regulator